MQKLRTWGCLFRLFMALSFGSMVETEWVVHSHDICRFGFLGKKIKAEEYRTHILQSEYMLVVIMIWCCCLGLVQ